MDLLNLHLQTIKKQKTSDPTIQSKAGQILKAMSNTSFKSMTET